METNQLPLTFVPATKREFLDFPLRADFSPIAVSATAARTLPRRTRGKAALPINSRSQHRTFN